MDDDIVKSEILLFETTNFDCDFKSYVFNSELRCGYYKNTCGDISSISSTNNWAIDTFFIDANNPNVPLIIHREFNILNYDKNSLKLNIDIRYKKGLTTKHVYFEFNYSWGNEGFQRWTSGNFEFINFFINKYSSVRTTELTYYGALL